MPERVTFKGWDWTELNEAFGLKTHVDDDDAARQELEDFLVALRNRFNGPDKAEDDVRHADVVRAYLIALGQHQHGYGHDVWIAIANVQDHWTMLKYFIPLLDFAWS